MNLSDIFALREDTASFVRAATDFYLRTDRVTGALVPIDVQFSPNPIASPTTLKPFVDGLQSILQSITLMNVSDYAKPFLQVALNEAKQRVSSYQNVIAYEISIGNTNFISTNTIENLIDPLFFGWFPGKEDRFPPAMADGLSIAKAARESLTTDFDKLANVFIEIGQSTTDAIADSASVVVEKIVDIEQGIESRLPSISSVVGVGALLAIGAGVATAIYLAKK